MKSTLSLKSRVKVRALSYLAEVLGFEVKEFSVEKPVKIVELIPELREFKGRLLVLVNGETARLEDEVSGGEEVVLSPVFGGG